MREPILPGAGNKIEPETAIREKPSYNKAIFTV
jgi:hypothetical protein